MRRNFWSKSWSQLLTKGPFIKDVGNFFGRFWYPPSQCRNFDPDLPNFFLLISCNIGIWDPPPPKNISTSFMNGPKSDVTFLYLSTNFSLIACIFWVISFMKIRFSDEASKSNDAGVLGFIKNRSSWRELIDLDAKTRLKKNHEYEIWYIKLKGW